MLLDSSLIIYASRPEHGALRTFIARKLPSVSAVSKVETLGYHELSENEKQFLEEFFDAAEVLSVSQLVIAEAIRLPVAEELRKRVPFTRSLTTSGASITRRGVKAARCPFYRGNSNLIALEASDDQHHDEAIQHWRQSVPEISSIVTTT